MKPVIGEQATVDAALNATTAIVPDAETDTDLRDQTGQRPLRRPFDTMSRCGIPIQEKFSTISPITGADNISQRREIAFTA